MSIEQMLKDTCWQKQGHKPSEEKKEKPLIFSEEELLIIGAIQNAPMVMLATAVIKQWILDGKPDKDYPVIKQWIEKIHESFEGGI